MKRKIAAVLAGVCLMGALTGCSGQISNDYVTIKKVKGIEIPEITELNISDDQLEGYIDYYLQADATRKEVTDRAAQNGDTVNIDYVGKVDGTEFAGGSAQGTELELGSGSFIGANGEYKGFEEQVEGHTVGETFDITVKFPDDYTAEMAGKVAVFTITLHNIYEVSVPELTDEWVKENSTESETVDEYKEEIRTQQENSELYSNVLTSFYDGVEVKKLPQDQIEEQYNTLTATYQNMAAGYGIDYETFVNDYMQTTPEELESQMRESAEEMVTRKCALELLADKKNLDISDEEYEVGLKRYAAVSGYTADQTEQFEQMQGKEMIRLSLLQQKAAVYLAKDCVQVEAEDTEESSTDGTEEAGQE